MYAVSLETIVKKWTVQAKEKAGSAYFKRYQKFNGELDRLFDVFCEDEDRRKRQEEKFEIPMLDEDF